MALDQNSLEDNHPEQVDTEEDRVAEGAAQDNCFGHTLLAERLEEDSGPDSDHTAPDTVAVAEGKQAVAASVALVGAKASQQAHYHSYFLHSQGAHKRVYLGGEK